MVRPRGLEIETAAKSPATRKLNCGEATARKLNGDKKPDSSYFFVGVKQSERKLQPGPLEQLYKTITELEEIY